MRDQLKKTVVFCKFLLKLRALNERNVKINTKPILLFFLIAVIGWMSFAMYVRTQEAHLWGSRTQVLFLSVWALFVMLFYPKNRWLGLASASGVLLGLGFPGWGPVPFLLFGAFVPLLQVDKELFTQSEKTSFGNIFKYSFHTFLLWNILSTSWIANSSLVAGIFTLLANSLLMTLPFLAFQLNRRVMPRLGYAPLLSFWLAFEYLHFKWELNYPWLTLGNGFAQLPELVQWYSYTGVFGGSLWILLANLLIFKIIEIQKNGASYRREVIQVSALIVIPVIISLLQYFTFRETGEKIEVVAVQPGYEPHYAEPAVNEAIKLDHCLKLAAQQVTATTDYLIFPEATFGYVEVNEMENYPTFQRLREFAKNYPNLHIITGASIYKILQANEADTDATRTTQGRDGQIMRYEGYNAAVQLSPTVNDIPIHKKSKLVPGPESFPFKNGLFFLEPLIEKLGGTTAGLGTEAVPQVFNTAKARIAPIICYESVFGEYVTYYTRRGAEALFIMTNDGWWDDTPGHWQHLYFASLRAVETRRFIARAANTGNSAFINQRGDRLQVTPYGKPAVIKSVIYLNDEPTFYIRWGDIIARINLFITILFLLNTLVKNITKKEA